MLVWAHREAATLGGDPERIAVVDDSSGGNFAAVLAQDRDVPIYHQLLLYPVLSFLTYRPYDSSGSRFGRRNAFPRFGWRFEVI